MVRSAKPKEKTVLKVVPPTPPPETNMEREAFHFHLGQIAQAQASAAFHRKNLKNTRRAAQDAGIVLHDLDTVMRMREEEPETVQAGIRRLATYAHWIGLAPGVQADLFDHAGKAASDEAAAEEEGYIDGLEGKTAEGDRYDAANPIGQARLRGWRRGQDVILKHFAKKAEEAPPTA